MNQKKLFRVKEYAEAYGISKKAIYEHIRNGNLPAHRIAGILFIDEQEVLESSVINPKEV